MGKSISIVIPNYNGKHLLQKNIPFVFRALTYSNIIDYEIIISDDNSVDDSVLFIKQNYPSIILIENSINKGFSGNVNSGIRLATKDLVLILNSDVQLSDKYFVPLLSFFNKSDTFGVMGKIIGLETDKLQDAAKYPQYFFGNINGTTNYFSHKQISLYSFFISGANALVDRKKILAIGCFNEIFNPYNWEDVDLGIRAWRLGFKIYYESSSYCRHPNSATIKNEPNKKVKVISKRNKMYLHYLHFTGFELIYFMIFLILKTIFKTILFDKYYLKSFYLFVKNIPNLNKYKNSFKSLQRVMKCNKSVKRIVKDIKSGINSYDIEKF